MWNFLENIVDLDSYTRIYSTTPLPLPSVPLFTAFGAAFPSIIQRLLFSVLKSSNLPDVLIHFLEGIHAFVRAVGRACADVVTLFLIMSGVIQGCPLASFCFAIVFDPFLNMFDLDIIKQKLGIVCSVLTMLVLRWRPSKSFRKLLLFSKWLAYLLVSL